jgi:hypothetical protein
MPLNLKQNDPKLWAERNEFIIRLKTLIGSCELSGNMLHLAAHEFLCEYSKKNKPEANRLFMLHPGNVLVINNALHISQKPSIESCVVALCRRRLDICRQLGFPNGKAMVVDFCRKVIKLQQDGLIKVLPSHTLTLSKNNQKST